MPICINKQCTNPEFQTTLIERNEVFMAANFMFKITIYLCMRGAIDPQFPSLIFYHYKTSKSPY